VTKYVSKQLADGDRAASLSDKQIILCLFNLETRARLKYHLRPSFLFQRHEY
jgi:hypothetical protein